MCQIVVEEVVSLTCRHTTVRETIQECGSPRGCCLHPKHGLCRRCWTRPYLGRRGQQRRLLDMRRSSIARTKLVTSPCPDPACAPPGAPKPTSRLKRFIQYLFDHSRRIRRPRS